MEIPGYVETRLEINYRELFELPFRISLMGHAMHQTVVFSRHISAAM